MEEYKCEYHSKELTEDFLKQQDLGPCLEKCPINLNKLCYRWHVCYIAREFAKENNSDTV